MPSEKLGRGRFVSWLKGLDQDRTVPQLQAMTVYASGSGRNSFNFVWKVHPITAKNFATRLEGIDSVRLQ